VRGRSPLPMSGAIGERTEQAPDGRHGDCRWPTFGTVSSAPRAECATERGQYRDLVQLVCVSVVAAQAAAERGPAPPGRAERGRLTLIKPESAVSCPMQLPRSDRQSRLPRAVMTLATAVVSGRVKMQRSVPIFDTGAGCRRNPDRVPYAVSAADRRWSFAAA
jgi:hypothetical protein